MPKKYRLSGEEIRKLSGKRMHGRYFSLLVANLPGTQTKCAVVASKKVSAQAVVRNTVKRRARNAVAKHIAGVKKPLALVFYTKREAKDATFPEITDDIGVLFSKL